jgi:hypothetical protein
MTQKRQSGPGSAEKTVRDIRRATRRHYAAEERTETDPYNRYGVTIWQRTG